MQISRILDPELYNSSPENEVAEILREVQKVQWTRESKFDYDDRVFMDVTGFGLDIYHIFCAKYPELKDKIIPVKSVGRT